MFVMNYKTKKISIEIQTGYKNARIRSNILLTRSNKLNLHNSSSYSILLLLSIIFIYYFDSRFRIYNGFKIQVSLMLWSSKVAIFASQFLVVGFSKRIANFQNLILFIFLTDLKTI